MVCSVRQHAAPAPMHCIYRIHSHHSWRLSLWKLLCVYFNSQLPSMSPWNSKEETVQTSSPSSVDTVMFPLTQTGYTMGQWREVNSLALPSLAGAMYSFQNYTEHRVTISGVGSVQALDGYIIQCLYRIQGNLIKSNAVTYSFIPPGQS